MTARVRHRADCRLCRSKRVELVLPMPATPVADHYVSAAELEQSQEKFPLDIYFCLDCGHLQLLDVVDPSLLFRNYLYVTSSSPGLVEHFRLYADAVVSKIRPPQGGLVVEIGSNDGSLLRFFQKHGLKTLGIDPAERIAKEATASGVETWPEFFESGVAQKIKKARGAAALAVANNVFAHADDLSGVAQGVRDVLAPDGVFVFEVAYLGDFVQKKLFDTIYHEHLSYHSVKPLQSFLKSNGLMLFDVERIATKGGSLRCFAQPAAGFRPIGPRVGQLIAEEEKTGLARVETFRAFAADLERIRTELNARVDSYRAKGKTVAGFGASPSSTTMIYYFGLGEKLAFLADDNSLKHNRFSPGFHIPVFSPKELEEKKPAATLILAWTYADMILKKNRAYLDSGGSFIVPLPEVKVISA